MLLENKNAIIYGAGGAVGTGVAKAFAQEGARVFLTGRTQEKLDKLAKEIAELGGRAETAVVDALDEDAVDEHAQSVADDGGLHISLNLVKRGDMQGVPLANMATADFTRAITTGVTTTFITCKAAARHMSEQGSGVILAFNSGSAHGSPMMGSTGPADAAIDTYVRNLAMEVGGSGVRVVGIWAAGIPETMTLEAINAVNSEMQLDENALQGILGHLDSLRLTKKSPSLTDIANLAVFLASDKSRSVTGCFVNATQMFTS
ncbi:SDR family oxidoreductase [Winogradskya consettensis]|uniref:3-oxoacyl-ACP reductase n=1 Tax=Winogradskya consettensis TaxID=113560 RepID=A0A919SA57_9ACTN|nr:SDR family oxidoreductase [Actinoplanes consettensis]GIM67743.1 3-oxoacyl-ACP reductase [Actinoplanes consettensis]